MITKRRVRKVSVELKRTWGEKGGKFYVVENNFCDMSSQYFIIFRVHKKGGDR